MHEGESCGKREKGSRDIELVLVHTCCSSLVEVIDVIFTATPTVYACEVNKLTRNKHCTVTYENDLTKGVV